MRYSGAVSAHVSPTLRRSGEAVGSRRRPPTHIYQTCIYSVNNSPWAVAALIYYLLTSGAHVVRGRCRVSPPPRPRQDHTALWRRVQVKQPQLVYYRRNPAISPI